MERDWRRSCVKSMNQAESTFRPNLAGLDAHFKAKDTMNQNQREHVVQFINEVCEDYGFVGQTAWTAVNYFDRFLSSAIDTPKRKIELISLSCLLVASKFLECRSPSLEDLCTLSQNRLTKEDFMGQELLVLKSLNWQLAVPSPHAYLLHLMALVDLDDSGDSKYHRPTLVQKHSEFFIDLSTFEYDMLSKPLGIIAGASLINALRQLDFEEPLHGDVDSLCKVLEVDQEILLATASKLRSCYQSCIRGAEDEEVVLVERTPANNFKPIDADDDSRAESPADIMASAAALSVSAAEALRAESPDHIGVATTAERPECKSPRPPAMTAGELIRAKRSRNTE